MQFRDVGLIVTSTSSSGEIIFINPCFGLIYVILDEIKKLYF